LPYAVKPKQDSWLTTMSRGFLTGKNPDPELEQNDEQDDDDDQ
jgi:hypothetical protein